MKPKNKHKIANELSGLVEDVRDLTPDEVMAQGGSTYAGGGEIVDWMDMQNDGMRNCFVALYNDLENSEFAIEDYKVDSLKNVVVYFREEKFSDVEKYKLNRFLQKYTNKKVKPEFCKFIKRTEVDGNRVYVYSKEQIYSKGGSTYAGGGEIGVGSIVAHKDHKTIGIVRDIWNNDGEARTDADGVVNLERLEVYSPTKHKDYQIAPSTKDEIETAEMTYAGGGNIESASAESALQGTERLIDADKMQFQNDEPLTHNEVQNADTESQPYIPESRVCDTVDTVAPVAMMYEMNKALSEINRKVRGIDHFVMNELKYDNLIDLCEAFSAEQVDGIAAAIYKIQQNKSVIIGDMTGVGKGRIAAAVMRYAKLNGIIPIFFTEKPNLFSDIYRDLISIDSDDGVPMTFLTGTREKVKKTSKAEIAAAIKADIEDGSFELDYDITQLFKKENETITNQAIEEYRELNYPDGIVEVNQYQKNAKYKEQALGSKLFKPFIINTKSDKTKVQDTDGNILYEPDEKAKKKAYAAKDIEGYDCVLLTYSQVNSPSRAKDKAEFLRAIAPNSILIMDESHNASGQSATGQFIMGLLKESKGAVYLSATYAKRPDNMPVYALKTSMQDAEMSDDAMIAAIQRGGVALQEVLSAQLTMEGELLRRQRSYEGIDVKYVYLDETQTENGLPQFDLKEKHSLIADRITAIVRKIMAFQADHVNPALKQLDEALKQEYAGAAQERGAQEAGINNPPIFSGIFNLINQMLFSIKADAVADFAIMRMKQGKKPIIAMSSTLESFLNYLIETTTDATIKTDFSVILQRRLDKTLTYTINLPTGEAEKEMLDVASMDGAFQAAYYSIEEDITKASVGITISPIDWVKKRIADAGYSVEEVTGRNKYVEFLQGETGLIKNRTKPNNSDVFREFNNNKIDCLLINQSGATGASAHAITTDTVNIVNYDEQGKAIPPTSLDNKAEVKVRVMLMLQAELDVNKEVQKRGRIFRTGEVFSPSYEYIISAVPAEERLMMMLQQKLISLDANTASNQNESSDVFDVDNFLNVYGDEKVIEFMTNNPNYNELTGNILKFEHGKPTQTTFQIEDAAHKVSGRIAILPIAMQTEFYQSVTAAYKSYEEQLKQSQEWNLEVEPMDLESKVIERNVVAVAESGKKSVFADAVYLDECEVNNLRKPYTKEEIINNIESYLTITTATGEQVKFSTTELTQYHAGRFSTYLENRETNDKELYKKKYEDGVKSIKEQPAYKKLKTAEEKAEFEAEVNKSLEEELEKKLSMVDTSIENIRRMVGNSIDYFTPKKVVAYPNPNQDGSWFKAVCMGINVKYNLPNPFAPSAIDVRLAFPNSMRYLTIPLTDAILAQIRVLTNDNWELRNQSESTFDNYMYEWDDEVRDKQADRVKRYIVSGNILKGYGFPEFRDGTKLISYTTIDKEQLKGILMPDSYKPDVRVKIPINKATPVLKSLQEGSTLIIIAPNIFSIQSQGSFYKLRLMVRGGNKEIPKDEELSKLLYSPEWSKQGGEFINNIEEQYLQQALDILWEKYKLTVSLQPHQFDAIKDKFNLSAKEPTTDGTDELINKYNEELEKYTAEKEFTVISDEEVASMDSLQKENYELRKQIHELKAMKHLFKINRLINKEQKRLADISAAEIKETAIN